MAKVKFPTEVKYNGVRYPAHTEFKADDNDLDSLRASGAIIVALTPKAEVVEEITQDSKESDEVTDVTEATVADEETSVPEKSTEEVIDLHKMTVSDLRSFAYKNGIDLGGVVKKDIVIEIIEEALKGRA